MAEFPAVPHPRPPSPPADAVRGALFMLGSGAAFAVMMAIVREVSHAIHPFEAAFFRNLIGLLFMLPWLLRAGPAVLRTGRFSVHALRAGFGLAAMLSLFYALSRLPLAETTALTFTAPLFATVGAALVLGERVRLRRWGATAIGFVGALIVLRPGRAAIDPAAFVALASAVFIAGAMLTIKALSRTEHPNAIVLIMGLLMTPASLVPAAFVWTWPSGGTWAWLVAMGLAATVGQVCLTRAFAAAEASAVLPVDFSRLVFVSILGYALFGEAPDLWTWVGAGVIVTATVYIAEREARLARKARKRGPGAAAPVADQAAAGSTDQAAGGAPASASASKKRRADS
jgi:drug/metabolite transporter (DMT)-like permease